MIAQTIIATNALTFDEGLRRGFHVMFGFEGVRLVARSQMVVFHLETFALEQVQ